MDLIYQKENLREYRHEAEMLLQALPALKSAGEVSAKLRDIFAHQFCEGLVRDIDFAPYAAIIYRRWEPVGANRET